VRWPLVWSLSGGKNMIINGAKFIDNFNKFPQEELEKYRGQWVAWNSDATAILAGTTNPSTQVLIDLVRAAGHDPRQCVFDYIPGPDEEASM
jgi:hypothetical protein